MFHDLTKTEPDDARFYHTTQPGMQFKAYEWFISGIFHLISLVGCWWHWGEFGAELCAAVV